MTRDTDSEAGHSVVPARIGGAQWLGAVICIVYGLAKLNGAQFTSLDSELSKPMGSVSGFWLTWYYFGYSAIYGSLIALLQVGAGILLVWPRWSLLGALLLLPVVTNIMLIDVFYGVDFGGILAALVLSACVIATAGPHLPRLRAAIVPQATSESGASRRMVTIVMLLIAGWGVTYWTANYNNRSPTPIDGTWTALPTSTGSPDSTRWTKVFFERNRAMMVVFRSADGSDEQHDFQLDTNRVVRIWKTWLKRDSLMMTGRWVATDSMFLTAAGPAPRDTLFLKRFHPAIRVAPAGIAPAARQ